MFARFIPSSFTTLFSAVKEVVYQYLASGIQHIAEKYLITTVPAITIEKDIEITPVQYLFSRWHVVNIKQSSETTHLLKPLMDLEEPDARAMYNLIPQITNSSFFLSMNDNKAEKLRSRLIACMRKSHHRLMQSTDAGIQDIVTFMRTEQEFTPTVEKYIKYKIRYIITEALTGLQLTTAIQYALSTLETQLRPDNFSMHPALPEYIRLMFGFYRQMKHKFNDVITDFLHHELLRLGKEQDIQHSIINEIIDEVFPGRDLHDIIQNESTLNALVCHPDLRVCVSGALAADNLSNCLFTGIRHLYQKIKPGYYFTTSHAEAITNEVNDYLGHENEITAYALLNEFKHLDLFWLECLRYKPPMPHFVRMTRNGLSVNDIHIPPQSMVVFEFAGANPAKPDAATHSHIFRTSRHDNGAIKLHKSNFTPFGAGARICPGIKLSELIFKKIMLTLASEVHINANNKIEVTEPKIKPRANMKIYK